MGKKEIALLLFLCLILSTAFLQNATPVKAAQNIYGDVPFEIIQIPGFEDFNLAIVKPDAYSGIRGLLLEKDWLWWRVARVSTPGEFRMQKDGELIGHNSTHFSYVAAIGLPRGDEHPKTWVILGETTANVETAILEIGNEKLEFAATPYGLTKYFYFVVSADVFSPEDMYKVLSLKLEDGHVIDYPFNAN